MIKIEFLKITSIAPIFEKESGERTEDLRWSVYSLVVILLVLPTTKKNAGIKLNINLLFYKILIIRVEKRYFICLKIKIFYISFLFIIIYKANILYDLIIEELNTFLTKTINK